MLEKLALLVLSIAPAGCNIAQGVDILLRPDHEVSAQYRLVDRPTVVLVDDRTNLINPVRLRREIADEATVVLMERGAVQDMISPRDAMAAARRLDTPNQPAGVDRIGRLVGAKQVIYVEALGWGLTEDGATLNPQGAFRVKVLDVQDRRRLFPTGDDGTPKPGILVRVHIPQAEAHRLSEDGATALSRELARRCGDAIARVFVDTGYNVHGKPLLGQ